MFEYNLLFKYKVRILKYSVQLKALLYLFILLEFID